MWGDISIAFMIALLIAYVATPYTIRLARKVGALDNPNGNKRKIHKKIMPRLGGLAIIAGFIVSSIYLILTTSIENRINFFDDSMLIHKIIGIAIAIIILGIICFIDDKKGIKPLTKLCGQSVAAIIVILCGVKITPINIGIFNTLIDEQILLDIITFGWIIGITNAINLTDGLDGLASGISLISCISFIILFIMNSSSLLSIIFASALAGAILGFMPYNFNPARTFLGDTGSNFLGFMLAVISILGVAKTYTAIAIIAPLLVFALPICDTSFAIIRRVIKEKSLKAVFKADRGHLHHKLIDKGYTQKQAVFILYVISVLFGLFATIWLESGIWKALSFMLLAIAICAVGYRDLMKIKKKNIIQKKMEEK